MICGFSQNQIGELLTVKRGNVQKFIKKYTQKWAGEILESISKYITKGRKKPTK